MTAVYIASALSAVRVARHASKILSRSGLYVSSTWHVACVSEKDPTDEDTRSKMLAQNLAELERADVLVALCETGQPRCCFTEVGYALAIGKSIVYRVGLLGEGRCLIDSHPRVVRIRVGDDLETAIERALDRGGRRVA